MKNFLLILSVFLFITLFSGCKTEEKAYQENTPGSTEIQRKAKTLNELRKESGNYPLVFEEAVTEVENYSDKKMKPFCDSVLNHRTDYLKTLDRYLTKDSLQKAMKICKLTLCPMIHATTFGNVPKNVTDCQNQIYKKFENVDFLISGENSAFTNKFIGAEQGKAEEMQRFVDAGKIMFYPNSTPQAYLDDMAKNLEKQYSPTTIDAEFRFLFQKNKVFGSEPEDLWLLNQMLSGFADPNSEIWKKLVEARSELSLANTVKFILDHKKEIAGKTVVIVYGRNHIPHYQKILDFYVLSYEVTDFPECAN